MLSIYKFNQFIFFYFLQSRDHLACKIQNYLECVNNKRLDKLAKASQLKKIEDLKFFSKMTFQNNIDNQFLQAIHGLPGEFLKLLKRFIF